MSTTVDTVRVKLVTIVAATEMSDGIEDYLKAHGASGYTLISAQGRGVHGRQRTGLFTMGNTRIETLLPPAAADELLAHLAKQYAGRALTAFSQDVDAIPREHFV
jgi:nitrogen regulatory protein PII